MMRGHAPSHSPVQLFPRDFGRKAAALDAHLMILPLTSISRRWLLSKDSAAAADAVDTLLSFP